MQEGLSRAQVRKTKTRAFYSDLVKAVIASLALMGVVYLFSEGGNIWGRVRGFVGPLIGWMCFYRYYSTKDQPGFKGLAYILVVGGFVGVGVNLVLLVLEELLVH